MDIIEQQPQQQNNNEKAAAAKRKTKTKRLPMTAAIATVALLAVAAPLALMSLMSQQAAYAIPPITITREGGLHNPPTEPQKVTDSQTSTLNVATEAITASK